MAYSVAQRSHEIGVRLALGADPWLVQRWITLRGVRLAMVGLSVGLIAASVSTRALRPLLFGVKPVDAPTFAVTAALLAAACLLASFIPAQRALVVDPLTALRGE